MFSLMDVSPVNILYMLFKMGKEQSEYTLQHSNVKKLMQSNKQFDVILSEVFSLEALLGFGQFYNAPVIAMSTLGNSKWTNDLIGNPSPLSYISHFLLSYTDRMTFYQRFHNTFMISAEFLMSHYYGLPEQRKVYDKYFPDPKPDFDDVLKNVSLVLLNSHFSYSSSRPYLPNMIEIGGIQIDRQINPLPEVGSFKYICVYWINNSF